jgi:hypothetical protein
MVSTAAWGADSAPAGSIPADPGSQNAEAADQAPEVSLADVLKLLQAQKDELASQRDIINKQRALLDQQQQSLDALRREFDAGKATPAELLAERPTKPDVVATVDKEPEAISVDPTAALSKAQDTDDQISEVLADGRSAEELAQADADQAASDQIREDQRDDPTQSVMTEFPGSFRIPGGDALIRIGGYVKTTLVNSFDPLAVKDRFIVGAIPVSPEQSAGIEAEANISVSQSRLNFELREPTSVGVMRAFVEGDFAEDNDTFRLRHAFGHWDRVLAGKTWSAFMDTGASPEEIDFEGLNGRVNVRQGQVRFSPAIGEAYKFNLSLEDPNPSVKGGEGVTERLGWFDTHIKVAALLRQVRAQLKDDDNTESEFGYGLSISGSHERPRWDSRNKVMFQLTAGKGIGCYINDLSSIGNFDGYFDEDGDLELLDVVSGYISGQFWWGQTLRSNLTFGYVEIDNPSFAEDDAYKRTFRSSLNLLWSPMPRILLGGEYLWGFRENEDGEDGNASQVQFSARYNF